MVDHRPGHAEQPGSGGGGSRRMLLRMAGWVVVFASLAFLGQRIWASELWTFDELRPGAAAVVCLAGAMIYAVNGLLLSTAWWAWLRWAGQRDARLSVCHGVYGRTQIAKYLPGNVFHFAGRHVLGRRAGFDHKPMVAAAVMEVVGLVSAATAIAVSGVGWFGVQQATTRFPPWAAAIGVAVLVALPVLAAMTATRLPGRLRVETDPSAGRWQMVRALAFPYVCYVAFMAVAGGLLVPAVRFGTIDAAPAPAQLIVGVFALSWLVGFLTPGASGGLGVREAAMVVPLSPYIGEPQAILAALIMRMITFGGDFGFYALAMLFPAARTHASRPNEPNGPDTVG